MRTWSRTLVFFLLTQPVFAVSEAELVAAVLMGEARGEGQRGLGCVAAVIATRSARKGLTPLQVVAKKGWFSCLKGTTPEKLWHRYHGEPVFEQALAVSKKLHLAPEELPDVRGATHFTEKKERPYWAKGLKPVVIVGNHAFYKLEKY